jgi:uracil-DNA glycosylase family 4
MAQRESIDTLSKQITSCTRCPRLAVYIRGVAEAKVKRFKEWDYWGKPVPGFGDAKAEVLIIGLAPAAHGANRTGRMFTGDSSGDWLYRALYETGFANQPTSTSSDDGLKLSNVFISATARCAPPDNKPLPEEIENCSAFLEKEIELLKNVKVVLCLGHIAFNRYCKLYGLKGLDFGHGRRHQLESGITLVTSYHPSRQNTQTGKLKWNDWVQVFSDIQNLLSS